MTYKIVTDRELALERENERLLNTIRVQAAAIEVMQSEIAASERNLEQLTDDLVRSRVELAALKAQPVREPVAWLEWDANTDEGDPDSILAGCNKPEITANGWYWKPLYLAAPVQPVPLTDATRQAIALAYGHLWHINNEPLAPIPLRSEESASYAARKLLRDLLTHEERGEAINAVRELLDRNGGAT